MAEKDATEKKLEDYADVFADIVNVLLFNGKEIIKQQDLLDALPRSIYKADKKLHEQERDVAKYWQKGQIRIALIGLENQSSVDSDMPLRIISYDGAVYRNELNAYKEDEPKIRFPVVTIVLYFGYKNRWRNPRNLKDCFAIPKELEPYFNDYKLNLFEIAWLPDETIKKFKSDFKIVADFFLSVKKK